MALVGMKTIAGQEFEVHASIYGSWDISDIDGVIGHGNDLDKAVSMAQATLTRRKVKISVPFITMKGKTGKLTGKHARTRKILVKIDDHTGTKQWDSYQRVFTNDIPAKTLAHYMKLSAQVNDLRAEMNTIENSYGRQVGPMVEDAIKQATEGAK